MKKTLKKLIALVTMVMMIASVLPLTAGAARVGDVVGYAQPTDIVATINGYQLESYNVNGLTYICVEDLRYYGFNVVYDNYTRSLSVGLDYNAWSINPQNANPNFWSIGSNNSRKPILYTDIVTYVNGSYVASSNINGRTIINFNELSRFGSVNYNNDRREISLKLDHLNYNELAIIAEDYEKQEAPRARRDNWNLRVRAKGNVLMMTYTSTNINYLSEVSNLREFSNRVKSGDLYRNNKDVLDNAKADGIDISSIYVEYYTKSGQLVVSSQVY